MVQIGKALVFISLWECYKQQVFQGSDMERVFLNDDDVLKVDVKLSPCGHTTSTVREMNSALCATNVGESWVREGIDCSVLFENSNGWRKGKVKITLEFIPDDPEPINAENQQVSQPKLLPSVDSQLDDLRKKYRNNS